MKLPTTAERIVAAGIAGHGLGHAERALLADALRATPDAAHLLRTTVAFIPAEDLWPSAGVQSFRRALNELPEPLPAAAGSTQSTLTEAQIGWAARTLAHARASFKGSQMQWAAHVHAIGAQIFGKGPPPGAAAEVVDEFAALGRRMIASGRARVLGIRIA